MALETTPKMDRPVFGTRLRLSGFFGAGRVTRWDG